MTNLQNWLAYFALVAIACLGIAACQPRPDSKVDLLLDWKGDPTYTGIYIAKELGYFRDAGLDVTITEGSGGAIAAQMIGVGQSHWIGTSSGSATAIARSKGAAIQSLAVIYPSIPTVLYSLEKAPIKSPAELRGKRIGLVGGSVTVDEFNALLKANNIPASAVRIVGVANDPTALLSGAVDGLVDYGELLPSALRAQGEKIVSFPLSRHGVDMYGLNIIANESHLKSAAKREVAKKVRESIIRGYVFVRERPEQAASIYMRVFPNKDKRYVLASLPIVATELGTGSVGEQSKEGWDRTIAVLTNLGIITTPLSGEGIIAK